MTLPALAIRRPVTTAMVFLAAGLLGMVSLGKLSVELMPEVVYPEIYISLGLRGAAPEQIEQELVIPMEGEIGRLEGVLEIESTAMQARGTVRVSYRPGTDMDFAALQAQSRLAQLLPSLPEQATASVQRFDTSDLSATIMELQVLGEGDLNWLRDFAEEKIAPELEAVEGIVSAQVMGGQRRAVEVIARQPALEAHGLTMAALTTAIDAANRPRAYLGQAYDGTQVYPVSARAQCTDVAQLRRIVVRATGPLYLQDVAEVRLGLQTRTDLSRINGKAAVALRLQKEDEANLIAVAEQVEATIARLNRRYASEGVELLVTTNQARIMQEALRRLQQAALAGLALGLAVLFVFLRNLRFVAVLLVAVPASLLITFNLMYAWGLSLNVLSLCGLALAMGMLTDNSIVVMESVFKRYEAGRPARVAAREGAEAVSRAVIASTATTVLVFLPVVYVHSDYQDILRQLALSIAFPLLASLLVALTLVPALAARALRHGAPAALRTGRLTEAYTVILKACLRHRARVAIGLAVVLAATLLAAYFLMLQQEAVREESQFTVYATLAEGATLEATDEIVRQLEAAVRDLPGVERFTSSVQEGTGSVTVLLQPRAARPERISVVELRRRLATTLAGISGATVGYDAPARAGGSGARGSGGARRQSGGFNLQTGTAGERIVIRGYDFTVLQTIAENLAYQLSQLEEIETNSARSDAQRSSPEVQVIPAKLPLFDRGLAVRDVLSAIAAAAPQGSQARTGLLEPDGSEVAIEIRPTENPEEQTTGLKTLRQLPVAAGSRGFAPLTELARVRTDEGRAAIQRSGQVRRAVVSYRFTSDILESQPQLERARELVRATVHGLALPEGYSVELVEVTTDTVYYWMMGIAAVLVYMVLAALFESMASPLIIFCTLPTAVIGSCWALLLSHTGLTSTAGPMALLGFIVLLGIAVNNGIILVDAVNTLRSRHGYRQQRAVLAGGLSRVRPILMTSATTLLGVLPLALEYGGDYEIWPPFAITVLGGLSVSMLATLIVLPVAYMGLEQVRAWLRRLGSAAVAGATAGTVAAAYAIHAAYASLFWTAFAVVPVWGALLALAWLGLLVRRARAARRQAPGPAHSVQLRTLTKAYGAPGKLRQEWARWERRARRLRLAGLDPVQLSGVRDSLWWKVPLLGLCGYLHTYFEDPLWLFLLAVATWRLTGHLAGCAALLWRGQRAPDAAPPARVLTVRRVVLGAAFLAYVHLRLKLLSVSVAAAAVWLAGVGLQVLVARVRSGKVQPQAIAGRLAWLRRGLYAGAVRTPVLGLRPPPFLALDGVDLEIGRGMFGLLGPNGAGKTTLLRLVSQVLSPTSGSVLIDGVNVSRSRSAQGSIGYLPQHFGLYDHLTAAEYLEYRALLEGFREPTERRQRVLACLEQVHLLERKDDRIGSYSGGMRQRVGIAQTLLHLPRIVIVDEPTAGLDPVERIRFRNLLARISQDRIVLFSTHIVEDIAGSCNRLAVLNRGKVVYAGTPEKMRALAAGQVWEAVLPPERFAALSAGLRLVTYRRTADGVFTRFLAAAPPAAVAARPVEPTLEDAYIHLLDDRREAAC